MPRAINLDSAARGHDLSLHLVGYIFSFRQIAHLVIWIDHYASARVQGCFNSRIFDFNSIHKKSIPVSSGCWFFCCKNAIASQNSIDFYCNIEFPPEVEIQDYNENRWIFELKWQFQFNKNQKIQFSRFQFNWFVTNSPAWVTSQDLKIRFARKQTSAQASAIKSITSAHEMRFDGRILSLILFPNK